MVPAAPVFPNSPVIAQPVQSSTGTVMAPIAASEVRDVCGQPLT